MTVINNDTIDDYITYLYEMDPVRSIPKRTFLRHVANKNIFVFLDKKVVFLKVYVMKEIIEIEYDFYPKLSITQTTQIFTY